MLLSNADLGGNTSLMSKMVEKGWLGKKSKQGFSTYTQPSSHETIGPEVNSGFQRFETVEIYPTTTMKLEYEDQEYESFEDNEKWAETRSVLLQQIQEKEFPYYLMVDDCESGPTTSEVTLVRKWEALLSDWLDRFGCGKID
jgi:hypothetical protein